MSDFLHTIDLTLSVMKELDILGYIVLIIVGKVSYDYLNEKVAHWRHKRDIRRGYN